MESKMTKQERLLIGKKISAIIKKYKSEWQELKEQISDYGYQPLYPAQDLFRSPIKYLVQNLNECDTKALISEWKSKEERIQFESDERYLQQYELYIMEEIVARAKKATYWM